MKPNYSYVETPLPSEAWKEMSPHKREFEITMFLRGFRNHVELVEAREDGHVILALTKPMSAEERGTLLLDIELYLKENVDLGLTVWLDPQEDKSSLRHLRGIEIKS